MNRLRAVVRLGDPHQRALVAELEERAAERLGVPHVVAVSSCTSGLILTLQALVEERPGAGRDAELHVLGHLPRCFVEQRRPRFVTSDPASFEIDIECAMAALDGASA